jgi:crotonobetainyl-CoA:carnitine CoA-transferase CaiB-like acyl-CoA transferase
MDNIKNLLVLELSSALAGPAVGQFFAELGARVIKVENPATGGDMTRRWKLPGEPESAPDSAYYWSTNQGKEVRMLNLRESQDREETLDLVRQADIVITNYQPGSARRLGMDAHSLMALNPRLIYARVFGFGPDDGRPAFDVVLQAEGGYMYMNGEADGPPVKMPVPMIDILASHQLREGILLALLERKDSGRGCIVETSLLASALSALSNQASNWLMAGHIAGRMGSAHPNITPYGEIFTCREGSPLVLAVATDVQFRAACGVLGLSHLAEDARFATNEGRLANRKELLHILEPAFHQRSRQEWLDLFAGSDVPAGSIRNMKEVFEQPAAARMIAEQPLPDGRLARAVRTVAFDIHHDR